MSGVSSQHPSSGAFSPGPSSSLLGLSPLGAGDDRLVSSVRSKACNLVRNACSMASASADVSVFLAGRLALCPCQQTRPVVAMAPNSADELAHAGQQMRRHPNRVFGLLWMAFSFAPPFKRVSSDIFSLVLLCYGRPSDVTIPVC